MLYVFYGTNEVEARDKANKLVSGLQSKQPDAELVRVSQDNFEDLPIDTLLATQGLFKSNYIIFLDNLDDEYKAWDDDDFRKLKDTSHICILLASKLPVATLVHANSYAEKVSEYKVEKKATSFNIFSAANALKARNKQELWTVLVNARLSGIEGEGITGMLFWAVKDMLVKRQFYKWREDELKDVAVVIAALPHKARRGGISVANALERFALSI